MKWEEFIKKVSSLTIIDTEFLLAGIKNPQAIKVQISRWKKAGKIIQLKRGIYVLAELYRKRELNEIHFASFLKKPSYISLEKAMEYYDLIPDAIKTYTSVTTKRPGRFTSELGIFDYRHIKKSLFWGYTSIKIKNQNSFMATPEKALLDFFYLKGNKITLQYLEELRIQNVDMINIDKLLEYAKKFKKTFIFSAAKCTEKYIKQYKKEERIL